MVVFDLKLKTASEINLNAVSVIYLDSEIIFQFNYLLKYLEYNIFFKNIFQILNRMIECKFNSFMKARFFCSF